MKINITLSAVANVLALANAANPDKNFSETNITLSAPRAAIGTGGRNTEIDFIAVQDQGFSGTETVSYTRQALEVGRAIATAKAVPIQVADGETEAQIKTKIATAFGLLESELTVSDYTAPVNENTDGTINLNAIPNSLLYTGTYAVTLTVADADVPLPEAMEVTDLDGFDPEN